MLLCSRSSPLGRTSVERRGKLKSPIHLSIALILRMTPTTTRMKGGHRAKAKVKALDHRVLHPHPIPRKKTAKKGYPQNRQSADGLVSRSGPSTS